MTHGRYVFRPLARFEPAQVMAVPAEPGVYIVYHPHGEPAYVGRSRCNIRDRLQCHRAGRGNRLLAAALRGGGQLWFEYECLESPDQAEAQLIAAFDRDRLYNLRRETDPADR